MRIERTQWDGQLLISGTYGHYVTPTARVSVGTFRFAFIQELVNRQLSVSVRRPDRIDLHPVSRHHADQGLSLGGNADGSVERKGGWVPFPAGQHILDLVDAGFGDPADIDGVDLRGKLALVQWGDDRVPNDGIPESPIWTDRIANIRRAGAAGVVLFPNPPIDRHSSFTAPAAFAAHWPGAGEQKFGIPEVQVKRREGLRLLAMLKNGTVTLDVRSDPNVREVYHLHPTVDQQIPEQPRFSFNPRNLAQVSGSTHAAGPLTRARYHVESRKPGTTFSQGNTLKFALPKAGLTEYFGPVAADVVYVRRYNGSEIKSAPRVFDRPVRIEERRNAAPYVPGAVPVALDSTKYPPPPGAPTSKLEYCAMCRQGDTVVPYMQIVAGGGDYVGSKLDTSSRLYAADGTEIPRTPRSGLPTFNLPAERGRYRLVQNDSGVTSIWTFTSSAPRHHTVNPTIACVGLLAGWTESCQPEPFVFLRYDLGSQLNLDNTVPAGRIHQFEVTAYNGAQSTQATSDIAGLNLWTSADDGKNWKPVLVVPGHRADGQRTFRVTTLHLNQPGTKISLKAEGWDRAGNRIQQSVPNAFTLSDRG